MKRDFTYVDDIVEGIVRLLNNILKENKIVKEAKKEFLTLKDDDICRCE